MISTRVGYAGGEIANPTYHHLGKHTESVEVTYDPRRISYQQLLDEYWNSFPWNIPPGPARVRTAVLPQTAEQLIEAEDSKRRLRRRSGEKVYPEIQPGGTFWPAERLHQKFHLQRAYPELVQELAVDWPDVDAFLRSTAAARLNGYVSGFLGEAALETVAVELGWEIDELRRRLEESESATAE